MSKHYTEEMRVVIPWEHQDIIGGSHAIVYEVDESGNYTGETVHLTHEQYRRLLLGCLVVMKEVE